LALLLLHWHHSSRHLRLAETDAGKTTSTTTEDDDDAAVVPVVAVVVVVETACVA
jgi:hypothetical protein